MSLPSAMRALQQTSLNGPQGLQLVQDVPVPIPAPGQILIRVLAAGVNFVDVVRSRGTFGDNPQPPFIGGFEAAGEVVARGAGVTTPAVGALVIGAGPGAFAEYQLLPAVAALPLPNGWTPEQALGLAINWPTALAVLRLGNLLADETVLIHGAAGATGHAALKLAKHFGARVIAVASPSKHAGVRAAGADHVLDARAGKLVPAVLELTGGRGADLVLESAGGTQFEASLAAARRITGRIVVLGMAGGDATLRNWDLVYKHPVQIIGFNLGALIQSAPHVFGQVMGELGALIAAGVVGPGSPTTYVLADGPRALADLENRSTVGKLALLP